MAGYIGLLAFWLGGAAAGDEAEPSSSTAVGDYGPVRSRGVGRRRRFFVELEDGKRVYGSPDQLQRIVDAQSKPPLAPRPSIAVPEQSRASPTQAEPVAAPLPTIVPVNLDAIRYAKALAEQIAADDEEAAILLLLT